MLSFFHLSFLSSLRAAFRFCFFYPFHIFASTILRAIEFVRALFTPFPYHMTFCFLFFEIYTISFPLYFGSFYLALSTFWTSLQFWTILCVVGIRTRPRPRHRMATALAKTHVFYSSFLCIISLLPNNYENMLQVVYKQERTKLKVTKYRAFLLVNNLITKHAQ